MICRHRNAAKVVAYWHAVSEVLSTVCNVAWLTRGVVGTHCRTVAAHSRHDWVCGSRGRQLVAASWHSQLKPYNRPCQCTLCTYRLSMSLCGSSIMTYI